jgi:hypothetical protein
MAEKGRQKRTKSLVEERGRWESLTPRERGRVEVMYSWDGVKLREGVGY